MNNNQGIHIRLLEEVAVEDEEVARVTVLIYPLPTSMSRELMQHIQTQVHAWCIENKLTSEGITDLTMQESLH